MVFSKKNNLYLLNLITFVFFVSLSFLPIFQRAAFADELVIGDANCTRSVSEGGWGGQCQFKATPWTSGCTGDTPKYVGLCDAGAVNGCCVPASSTVTAPPAPYENKLLSEDSCKAQKGGTGVCKLRATPGSDGCDNATEESVGLCAHWYSTNADGCCVPKTTTPPSSPPPTSCTDSIDGFAGTCVATGSCTGNAGGQETCGTGKVCCFDLDGGNPTGTCTGQGKVCRSDCKSNETSTGVCSDGTKCCISKTVAQTSAPQTINFTNPLKFSTVEGVLGSILGALRGIIVVLSLVFIVIGAVMYITSAGSDKQMTLAKGAITAALIGLAIGIAAPSFLKEIGGILGWGGVDGSAAASARTLTEIATSVLNFLLSIVGILSIIMLVIGGIMYLTAAGNENQLDTAKKIVWYAIIGIITALASLVIVSQITSFFL